MANNIKFQAMGQSVRLNAITASSTEVSVNALTPCNQIRVHNGANQIAIRFSATTGQAAAFPTAGSPEYGIVMHQNATEIFTVPQSSISAQATLYVSAISAGGASTVYLTPGEGL